MLDFLYHCPLFAIPFSAMTLQEVQYLMTNHHLFSSIRLTFLKLFHVVNQVHLHESSGKVGMCQRKSVSLSWKHRGNYNRISQGNFFFHLTSGLNEISHSQFYFFNVFFFLFILFYLYRNKSLHNNKSHKNIILLIYLGLVSKVSQSTAQKPVQCSTCN